MPRRRYSDDERAAALAALAANGGDLRRTARELGIPFSTLKTWARKRAPGVSESSLTEKKADLAQLIREQVCLLLLASAGKIDGARLGEVWTAVGIGIDKLQLLLGQATSIVRREEEALSDDYLVRRTADLGAKLRLLRPGDAEAAGAG